MRRLLATLLFGMVWAMSIGAGPASTSATGPTTGPSSRSSTQPDTARAAAEAKQRADTQRRQEQEKANSRLAALSSEAESAAGELTDLTNKFVADGITAEIDQESGLWSRQREIDGRLKETDGILAGAPTLENLRQQQAALNEDQRQLTEWADQLKHRDDVLLDGIRKLETQRTKWSAYQDELAAIRVNRQATTAAATTTSATQPADVLGRFTQRVDTVLKQNSDLAQRYEWEHTRISDTLTLTISGIQLSVKDSLTAINVAQRQARDRLLYRDSPGLWTALLHPMVYGDVTEQGTNTLTSQSLAIRNYTLRQWRAILLHAAIVTVLAATLIYLCNRTKQWTGSDPTLLAATRVFNTPIATAITASMILTPWIYIAAPRLFWGIVGTAALVPTIMVLRPLIAKSLQPLLYGLAAAVFVNLLLSVVAALPLVYRSLQLVQMGGAAVFFLWFLRTRRGTTDDPNRPPLPRWAVLGARLGLAITVFAGLANVFGYVSLSRLIGSGLITAAYLGVLLDTSVHVIDALLLGISHVKPISTLGMVQRHRPLLLSRLHKLLVVLAIGLWGFFTLDALTIRQSVFDTVANVWNFPQNTSANAIKTNAPDPSNASTSTPQPETSNVDVNLTLQGVTNSPVNIVGTVKVPMAKPDAPPPTDANSPRALLTVGGVILFVLSIAGSIYAARFIAFLLDEDVYPRLNLARGMPYAISTLLKYIVLAVGFTLAIVNLGFDPTKLAILASAFSIGLGFGLQNIVNNFVGGLILLFERPVQVGDVIELDNITGVVSRIGIRASVIRTPLAAEIIVPNGRLISDRVVNWTLSNRQRGIELPVTIAAGPEPQQVIKLLISAAKQHPLVAAYPAPQAYFTDFSGGGLKFEVRCWTNRFEDWATVRSEVAMAVNATLLKENVQLK